MLTGDVEVSIISGEDGRKFEYICFFLVAYFDFDEIHCYQKELHGVLLRQVLQYVDNMVRFAQYHGKGL